ncbi:type II secretion system protein [Pelomonas sp. SE-A7]|uniref:type II secretion system protein n=1 Tax=Pelomonas sp. SE-A7 TaxID=3054953 RepID=UPI00259C6EDB|nr:type II secretion system protein [Pelomonas sp. SE-A7]MDM4767017.1 type II secretion system protein [Pelomonas sp. SE-A7]
MKQGRGFTLVEMLVVLAIVGVLASAARPLLIYSVQRSQEFQLREALRQLRGALDAYKRASDAGQIVRAVDASGYPPTLRSLVEGVPDQKSPRGEKIYFLRRLPRDPFAEPGVAAEETWALRAYETPPDAPRAGRDVFDVASRSDRKALDGSRYRDW